MRDLINNVIQWANDRNIIDGSTPAKQLEKTAAELVELCVAVGRDDLLREMGLANEADSYLLEQCSTDCVDGIGDVLVTLIIVTEQLGLDLEDCLRAAYSEIKDRRGEMRDGKFVKEADL